MRLLIVRKHAFTLVELLVVIAIVAVLAAFLLPVFSTARKRSHLSVCTSNLRQIGQAFEMYLADYGQYPPDLPHSTYVKDQRLLFCPDDRSLALLGAASSYMWDFAPPPGYRTPLSQHSYLDPNIVLVSCDHHLGRRVLSTANDDVKMSPPSHPYYLVLRVNGAVESIPLNRIRRHRIAANTTVRTFPGEPGYETAEPDDRPK